MTSTLRDENAECHNNSIAASYWLLQKGFLHWKTCFRSIFKAACRSFFVLPTYVKLHLEPRYNSCTLRCKHQRSVIKKHEAHTIMLTTKSTPIVCTYGSARLHLKAKFEKSIMFLSSTISHARWFPFMPSLIHGYPLFFLLLHISVLICVAWHLMLSLLLTSV